MNDWRQAHFGPSAAGHQKAPPPRTSPFAVIGVILAVVLLAGGTLVFLDYRGLIQLGLFARTDPDRPEPTTQPATVPAAPDPARTARLRDRAKSLDAAIASLSKELIERQAVCRDQDAALEAAPRARAVLAGELAAAQAARDLPRIDRAGLRLRNFDAETANTVNSLGHNRGIEKSLFERLVKAQSERAGIETELAPATAPVVPTAP